MNDDERRRILRLVAEGKITAEEGADLLDALQEEHRAPEPDRLDTFKDEARRRATAAATAALGRSGRSLVIRISEGDESKVNLRIPLGLAKAAGKFIPRRAQQDLNEHGIDLTALFEGVASGADNGPLLEIHDDEDTVYIAVE